MEPANLPVCVSGKIKRQVLDKCKTQDPTAGLTALLWNLGCCFFCALFCTRQNPRPALYQTPAQIDLNLMHSQCKHCIPQKALKRRETGELSSATLPIHCVRPQVIQRDGYKQKERDRKKGREAVSGRQAGRLWGLLLCFLSMLNYSTLPAACLRVCRLCGLHQQASQESRRSSLTNNSAWN